MRAARRRSRPGVRPLLALLALGAVFVTGVGLGGALHDGPAADGTRSLVRTLVPQTVAPIPARTVTVTTTATVTAER